MTVDALLGAYVFGLVPALLVGSAASDRHGRKRLMIAALAASILGSVALSTAALPGMAVGRLFSGIGIGLAMSVGTAWVIELTARDGLDRRLGARRAAVWMTAGFCAGAAIAGVLAQWAPKPEQLPYLVQVAAAAAALAVMVGLGIETTGAARPVPRGGAGRRSFWPGAIRDPTFRRVVVPIAPWIFGVNGIAYATVPQALDSRVAGWTLLYATILTVCTLLPGFLIQPLAHRLEKRLGAKAAVLGMGSVAIGVALAAVAVSTRQPLAGALAAVSLGCSYGIVVVTGLLQVQRIADPRELARTTGLFYAVAYLGFLAPTAIAIGSAWSSVATELAALAVLAVTSAALVARATATKAAGEPRGPRL